MEGNLIVRGRERLRETIDGTIKNDLDLNNLSVDMIINYLR